MEIIMNEKVQQTSRNVPPAPRLDPWLVFCHGRRLQNQTFFSISENRYHVKNIPDMRRKYICSCSHGWLVLLDAKDDSNDCFLLNPISMDKVQLPSWKPDFMFSSCVLSSSPNDSNCTVLFLGESKDGYLSLMSYRLGIDNDWCEHKLDTREFKKDVVINKLTCCAGKLYALTHCDNLVTIDIDSTPMVIKKVEGAEEFPCPLSPEMYRSKISLVESCGELFGVKMFYFPSEYEVRGIEVFKLDINRNIWARAKNLGERVFFIGRSYCVSCSTIETKDEGSTPDPDSGVHTHYNQTEKENARVMTGTIYFTLPEDRSLYAYKLEDHTIVTTLPCPNVVSDWSQPEWILPLALD